MADKPGLPSFYQRVRWLVGVERTTATDLALKADLTHSAISQILARKASGSRHETAVALSKKTGCSLAWLVGNDGPPFANRKLTPLQRAQLFARHDVSIDATESLSADHEEWTEDAWRALLSEFDAAVDRALERDVLPGPAKPRNTKRNPTPPPKHTDRARRKGGRGTT